MLVFKELKAMYIYKALILMEKTERGRGTVKTYHIYMDEKDD